MSLLQHLREENASQARRIKELEEEVLSFAVGFFFSIPPWWLLSFVSKLANKQHSSNKKGAQPANAPWEENHEDAVKSLGCQYRLSLSVFLSSRWNHRQGNAGDATRSGRDEMCAVWVQSLPAHTRADVSGHLMSPCTFYLSPFVAFCLSLCAITYLSPASLNA